MNKPFVRVSVGAGSTEGRCGPKGRRSRRDKLWGGILLISAGVFLLMVQYDLIREFSMWNWWPLWPIGIGVWKLAQWDDPEELGSAVTFILLGVWLMISNFGWYGLTWRNSWPLALVAVGAGMVVRALASSLMASQAPPADGEEVRHD